MQTNTSSHRRETWGGGEGKLRSLATFSEFSQAFLACASSPLRPSPSRYDCLAAFCNAHVPFTVHSLLQKIQRWKEINGLLNGCHDASKRRNLKHEKSTIIYLYHTSCAMLTVREHIRKQKSVCIFSKRALSEITVVCKNDEN